MTIPTNEAGRLAKSLGTVARAALTPFASSLTAPFVGSDMTVLPATSSFGVLARMVRLNALEPVDLFRQFGIRTRRADDLSEVMTFSGARQSALARSMRLSAVPQVWNLTAWFPFQSSSSILRPEWVFRYCPQCIYSGYHTLLHQLPWIYRCPWHGIALRTSCGRCGKKPPALADWCFDQNLNCPCGHVLLSTEAALKQSVGPLPGANEFIATYLAWAAKERARTLLITPELPVDTQMALASLVQLPERMARTCGRHEGITHRRFWKVNDHGHAPDQEAIEHLEVLRQVRPGFLTIPTQLKASIAQVAANLALKLPTSTLTDREMKLFLAGAGIEAPEEFQPAKRRFSGRLSALPPWDVAGRRFLNLACLHPVAYRPIPSLIDIALDGRSVFDFQVQARHGEFDLLIRVCGSLLARGYAEGLRATLSRHIPELFEMGRDSPHLTQPWMLAVRDQGRLIAVHGVWRSMDSSHSAADLLEQADESNQRRERVGRGRRRSGSGHNEA